MEPFCRLPGWPIFQPALPAALPTVLPAGRPTGFWENTDRHRSETVLNIPPAQTFRRGRRCRTSDARRAPLPAVSPAAFLAAFLAACLAGDFSGAPRESMRLLLVEGTRSFQKSAPKIGADTYQNSAVPGCDVLLDFATGPCST